MVGDLAGRLALLLSQYLLKRVDDEDDPAQLQAVLTSPRYQIRLHAVRRFGALDDPAAVRPLLEVVDGRDPRLREEARWGLSRIVRRMAMAVLEGSHDIRRLAALIDALLGEDPKGSSAATGILRESGNSQLIEALLRLLGDGDPEVRSTAVKALGRLHVAQTIMPLISALEDADGGVVEAAAAALGEIGDARALAVLLDVVRREDDLTYPAVTRALLKVSESAGVEPLVSAVQRADVDVRAVVAHALYDMESTSAVTLLLALSCDDDPDVAWSAMRKLERCVVPVDDLGTLLQSRNARLRRVALEIVLSRDWYPGCSSFLADAWRQAEVTVRWEVASDVLAVHEDICASGIDPELADILMGLLGDADADVRLAVLEVLGNSSIYVRRNEALLTGLLDTDSRLRRVAVTAIWDGLEDERFVEPLIAVLRDEEPDIRWMAAAALGWHKDPRAIRPLLAALNDADEQVRECAANALEVVQDWLIKEIRAALNRYRENGPHPVNFPREGGI